MVRRKQIEFPHDDYWPVEHRKLRIRKKYRNRWYREQRNFISNLHGLHTRWMHAIREDKR